MLPFIKAKSAPGIIMKLRKPDGSLETQGGDDSSSSDDLSPTNLSKALIAGIKAEDAEQVADAIEAIFTMLDSRPHEEGPHTNESEEG